MMYHTWLYLISNLISKALTLLVMASEMDPESWGGADYARPLLRLQEAHWKIEIFRFGVFNAKSLEQSFALTDDDDDVDT